MSTLVLVVTLLLPPLPGAKSGTPDGTAQTATQAPAAATTFDPEEISVPAGASTGMTAYLDVEGFEGKDLRSVEDLPPRKNENVVVRFMNPRRVSTAQNIWAVDVAID